MHEAILAARYADISFAKNTGHIIGERLSQHP
jgi:hypothetical protein